MSGLDDFEPAEGYEPQLIICDVCGLEVPYNGKGRPPKRHPHHTRAEKDAATKGSTPAAAKSTPKVETALSLLATGYTGLATGLVMLSLPAAAAYLAENVDSTQEQNRIALENDPKLVDMICKFGQKSGRAMFIAAQLSLLGGIGMIAAGERAERKAFREMGEDAAPTPGLRSVPPQAPPPGPQVPPMPTGPTPRANPLRDAVREARGQ